MSLSKIAADSLAATNRAGSGPSANQLQMEAFSQQSRDEWHLMMEKTRGEARGSERISLREKYCYKTYLTAPWDPTWSQKEKKKCNWVKEVFFVEDGELKRKPTKRHPVARVVKHEAECFEAIVATHLSLNHAGQDATTHAVLKDFYGISKQEVLSLVKHCSICARSRPSKAKGPLQPIQSKRVFERVQIDLIDMGSDPDGQYLWIAHMVDHFSKFHFMYAMPNKESSTVARVVHHWICTFGNMEILQSDNGTEFKGVCEEILLRYGVQVINGRPRTPRTQGLVEQANGTVKKRITAWKRQTGNPFWHEALEEIALSMNCTYTRSIGTTPYMIVFNRKPTYRRIPLYSRPGCEIQDELLDEAAAPGTVDEDEALKNFIHEQYTEVTDAEFEEIDRAMRQKMADQQFQRRLANDLAKTSEDAGPSKDISEDAGPSKDALGKEQAKQVEGIPDSDDDNDSSLPNSGLPSSGNDDSDHGSDQQLQQLQKKVTGDTSQLPIKVPSHTGHTDSEWTDSELDAIEAEIAANRAARRKEDTSANGHKGPSTPPKDRANESDSGTDDMLSPSLGALRLGNRGNRSGIHELDSTPTTAARIGVKEFQQRAQARSIKQYGKQRRVQVYEIGQNVSVAIPREDRSSTDDKRLFGKVIMSFPEMNQYEVVTQWGVLDRYCPISIVNPVEDAVDVGVPEPPPRNKVSIAHCAGQQSMSQKVLVKCDCRDRKTWCSKRTCRCIKAEVKCSVHCHQSQGHPDTRIECPNVAPAHEWTRMGLGTREQQREQEQVEKRARKDAAGNWVSTKGIGFGPVDEHGKVDERVRKELVQKKQRRRG